MKLETVKGLPEYSQVNLGSRITDVVGPFSWMTVVLKADEPTGPSAWGEGKFCSACGIRGEGKQLWQRCWISGPQIYSGYEYWMGDGDGAAVEGGAGEPLQLQKNTFCWMLKKKFIQQPDQSLKVGRAKTRGRETTIQKVSLFTWGRK